MLFRQLHIALHGLPLWMYQSLPFFWYFSLSKRSSAPNGNAKLLLLLQEFLQCTALSSYFPEYLRHSIRFAGME
jgi:hypothetical protein